MTKIVIPSITKQIGAGTPVTTKICITSDQLEEDLKKTMDKLYQIIGHLTLEAYDKKLRQEEYKEGKVRRTEARTYKLRGGNFRYARRTIEMPDGRICKPLDELLGFKKYSRQSERAKEQICTLAAYMTYRSAAILDTYTKGISISPSTVC